ncbi:site-2 protease family protein [Oryzobacter telluris]|uniref:site-2 protease family protein n=1 Tax=Oryzobacter telluris TaxID=3149179 RepID=UPI00370D6A3B
MSDEKAPAGAVRLARVAGVPVYLDRTWLFLAAFIAWTGWQAGRDLGPGTAVAYALWLVVGILIAVLGHEVAHALAGRLLGFRVHRIVATLWGGHTSYDGTGITPGRAAVVAVSGPLANLLLAGIGFVASAVLPWPASEFAWSFFSMNLLLAGFNLLPGLPLDGGQVVESLVWKVSGRRDLGLVVAGWCGRVLAVLLVLWFLVRPLALGRREDLDLLSVGLALVMAWILWSGATAAIRRAPLERVLRSVRLGDVAEAVTVLPTSTPLGEARLHPDLVVCEDEHGRPTLALVGELATDAPPSAPIGSVVLRLPDENVVEAGPEDAVDRAISAMATSRVALVVLTQGGRAWGMVSASALEAAAARPRARN